MTESLPPGPHRRYNPLVEQWVLVSPHRTQRPWQGQVEKLPPQERPTYDPGCYLCPGNSRAGGVSNPDYADTFVFDNDFPALLPESDAAAVDGPPWMRAEPETGTCRVVCFSPRHDLSLGSLDTGAVRRVIDTWADEVATLMAREDIGYVQVFENRGAMMGCSNPHPHGQIWATRNPPNEVAAEDTAQARYRAEHGEPLLGAVLRGELAAGGRVLFDGGEWVALVPFWAVWPFEALLLPKRQTACLTELDADQRDDLAEAWPRLVRCYDALFGVEMPMSSGWHGAPERSADRDAWWLHAHFYPPLLRSATVKKFMVGYEMLGGPQRDITAEAAADRLRAVLSDEATGAADTSGR